MRRLKNSKQFNKNMKRLILLLILIFSLPVAAQDFTIGKSTFLLNGKPFTVKAAELHYTRIPAPY